MSNDINRVKFELDVDRLNLEDGAEGEVEFQGATLAISSDTEGGVGGGGGGGGIGSGMSKEDLRNSGTVQGEKPDKTQSNESGITDTTTSADDSKDFFAKRVGAFENAVKASEPIIMKSIDGELVGAWLLTEIDHWDTEKERLILLTKHSLLLIKYDFITLTILEYRRLLLKDFDKVAIGNFTYPQASVVPRVDKLVNFVKGFVWDKFQKKQQQQEQQRQTRTPPAPTSNALSVGMGRQRHTMGVRIMWNKGKPVLMSESWNPWSRSIPWITLTSHPLASQSGSVEQVNNYDIEHFVKIFLRTLNQENEARVEEERCRVEERPIVIENYLGLASFFHNVNNLGFFKARGKVSF